MIHESTLIVTIDAHRIDVLDVRLKALTTTTGKWTKASALMSEAILAESTNGTTFTFGPSGAVLYPTTGASVDHIYTIGRAEWSYTIELPDTGNFGFVLPPERIRPTVIEQWAGQQVLLSLLDEEFFDGKGPAIITT